MPKLEPHLARREMRLRQIRCEPERLLGIGLPLTILLGFLVALVLFHQLDVWEAALLGARALGLRCFILSNTSFLHSRAIFTNEVCCTVPELHALSFKLGWMKPDPRCWTWLLERAGLPAGDCLYVDDVAEYCGVAAGLGFRTLHYEIGAMNLLQAIAAVLYSG